MYTLRTRFPYLLRVVGLLPVVVGFGLFFGFANTARAQDLFTLSTHSATPTPQMIADALTIQNLRARDYPGSDLTIEQTLVSTSTYTKYIASYLSDGIKINGLLTVPKSGKPKNGFPAIIFNHGYVTPEVYTTDKRYIAYVDYFAKRGYVVFKPDYRGHAESGGIPESVYYSPGYTIDVLNALASVKKYPDVNPDKIGMWGHSMGGHITLNNLVVTSSIKAAVIWGGVVAPYADIMYHWPDKNPGHPYVPSPRDQTVKLEFRKLLIDAFGSPLKNPKFWNKLDPITYIKDIKTPIQLDYGTKDLDVPPAFSTGLYKRLIAAKKTVQMYSYKGANHNISLPSFTLAMQRSVAFFDKYLKK